MNRPQLTICATCPYYSYDRKGHDDFQLDSCYCTVPDSLGIVDAFEIASLMEGKINYNDHEVPKECPMPLEHKELFMKPN